MGNGVSDFGILLVGPEGKWERSGFLPNEEQTIFNLYLGFL
ncbi:4010_t:CDS:1, partial [Cetraspora pellucida]